MIEELCTSMVIYLNVLFIGVIQEVLGVITHTELINQYTISFYNILYDLHPT